MKIVLEDPFKSFYKTGSLVINPEGRKNVILRDFDSKVTTISYARYLMCVHLGQFLPLGYEVDHIDNDKTNDNIENLQVLLADDNREKRHRHYIDNIQIRHNFNCSYCDKEFVLTDRQVKMKQKAGIINYYCSRECSQSAIKNRYSK